MVQAASLNQPEAAAVASFKAVLKMVPNNSVAKYYLGKSIDGQKQAENGVVEAK